MAFKPWTAEDFLRLFLRIAPKSYSASLESEANGQGMDPYAAMAKVNERVSQALNTNQQAYYIRPSSLATGAPSQGEAKATVTLQISRAAPAAGSVILPRGTLFVADVRAIDGTILNGDVFESTVDVTFAAGVLGPLAVPVQAVRAGYQGNVLANSIKRFVPLGNYIIKNATIGASNVVSAPPVPDRFLPTMLGRYVRIISGANINTVPRRILSVTQGATDVAVLDSPALTTGAATIEVEEWQDLGFVVSQPQAAVGGRHGTLDANGEERNIGRQPGESDNAYRKRVEAVSDVVSPGAIYRAVARVLTPYGIPFEILETRDPHGFMGFIYDLHPYDVFDIDDPLAPVYVGPTSATRFFLVKIQQGLQGDFGFFYDANVLNNAYDVSNMLNFYDGTPVIWNSLVRAVEESLNQAKAAGIAFRIVRYSA